MRADRFFLATGLLFGAVLALVTPPFQVPDEPAHFYRAYMVSEGRLVRSDPGRDTGEVLPASLPAVTRGFYPEIPFHEERKVAPAAVLAALRVPLEPKRREFVYFPNTLAYTAVPYLPQAVAMTVGRLAGAPVLALLYLGRFAGLLTGVFLIHAALRRLPAFRWLAALIALTPMALFLRSGLTADTVTLAAGFLLAAAVARLAWGEGPGRRSDVALMIVAAAILCLSKPVYVPLALTALAIPASRFPGGRRLPILLLHLSVTSGAFLLAAANARLSDAPVHPGLESPDRQLQVVLEEPGRVLRIVAVDYAVHAPRYLTQLVGKLGWLDVELPPPFLLAYLGMLAMLLVLDANPLVRVSLGQRALLAIATVATLGAISVSIYVLWTPYRADFLESPQGRYFLPLLPAAAWIFHAPRLADRVRPERLGLALALFSILSFAISLWAILERYY
ncbi:MAG TPA: DUF2142 domain-containing protein [Thermoanaerobaculia bacterium]|nr:DUF2142 domain-containing protein [Thermoanaerobaculia bacterium]